jgi:hypothetical protein
MADDFDVEAMLEAPYKQVGPLPCYLKLTSFETIFKQIDKDVN